MKKHVLLFLFSILLPATILGVLALRTAGKQQVIMEQQETSLRQIETDQLAEQIQLRIKAEHENFVRTVEELLTDTTPESLSARFPTLLKSKWEHEGVGFAVTLDGSVLSPKRTSKDKNVQDFLASNVGFLGNRIAAEVYQVLPQEPSLKEKKGASTIARARESEFRSADSPLTETDTTGTLDLKETQKKMDLLADQTAAGSSTLTSPMSSLDFQAEEGAGGKLKSDLPISSASAPSTLAPQLRKIAPLKAESKDSQALSKLYVEKSRFSEVVSRESSGILSRFVEDKLEITFWMRPPGSDNLVFGVQIDPASLHSIIDPLVTESRISRGICFAILDDKARPYAKSLPEFATNWDRPFVATEIGEILPHWEAALYLTNPDSLTQSAKLLTFIIVGLITLALGTMAWGAYLIMTDTRRQLALVQKKTDFVSNVSHELKTPLTSIRMFAELLHEKRVIDPDKISHYLKIIVLESERLTRLINNVLDFARIERNQKRYRKKVFDLHPIIQKVWESQELHLQEQGFSTKWHAEPSPYPVEGDEDAISQIIVNLLSNAEKYSQDGKEIELHSYMVNGEVRIGVLDRGPGVPLAEEKKIFEHFYRAHDSLSSGIPGSGLGLTLAKKIAEDHGGNVSYEPRKQGGSIFTLHLPRQTSLS